MIAIGPECAVWHEMHHNATGVTFLLGQTEPYTIAGEKKKDPFFQTRRYRLGSLNARASVLTLEHHVVGS